MHGTKYRQFRIVHLLNLGDQIMYERFSDILRAVLRLADDIGKQYNHEYIGTEHLLLGLLEEGRDIGFQILQKLEVVDEVTAYLMQLMKHGPDPVRGKLPLTPRAKKVLTLAEEESRNWNHTYTGTEHLLLGLLQEKEGCAAEALTNNGVTIEKVRQAMCELLSVPMPEVFIVTETIPPDASHVNFKIVTPELQRELDALKRTLQQLSDVVPLDPNISDADLVQMARSAIQIHEVFKKIR